MPEVLTESFCERCGTRYTFESAAPKAKRIGRFKTMSKGLKNFVMSDDTSLDEAFAAARSDQEREATAQQLDAFHRTFNFCMSCRQYTCANCWNEVEGRCLTCAPHLGHEILPAPFPNLEPLTSSNGHAPVVDETPRIAAEAWPTVDLRAAASPTLEAVAPAEELQPVVAEALVEVAPPAAGEHEPEGALEAGAEEVLLVEPEPAANPEAAAEAEALLETDAAPEAIAIEADSAVEPVGSAAESVEGQQVDEAVAAGASSESLLASVEADPPTAAPETAVPSEPSAESPVAAEPEPSAESPVAAEPEPEPGVESEPSAESPVAVEPEPIAEREVVPEAQPIREPEVAAATPSVSAAPETLEGRAAAAAARTAELLARFRPGQSLDDAIDAYVAELDAAEPQTPPIDAAAVAPADRPEPGPAAAEAVPQPEVLTAEPTLADVASEPEPPVAEAAPAGPAPEPEPEPQPALAEAAPPAPAPAPEPAVAEPAAEPAAARSTLPPARPDDRVEVPTWRVVAPEAPVQPNVPPPAAPSLPQPSLPAAATAEPQPAPQWPSVPQWPSQPANDSLAFLANRSSTRESDGLWAASTQEVISSGPAAPTGIQSCVSCGLSLSANARFCRRCGARQD